MANGIDSFNLELKNFAEKKLQQYSIKWLVFYMFFK